MFDDSRKTNFAPIVIQTYKRQEHLQKTIEALLKNKIAKFTDLFIASDAPSNKSDEDDVNKVRNYIKTIIGFRSVNLIYREVNFGLNDNALIAFQEVFKKYDKLISIEEDIIVGTFFLNYINDGLNLYSDDENVFAICGYQYKNKLIKSNSDVVLLSAFAPWGVGIWRDKFNGIGSHKSLAIKFLSNPYLFIKLNFNRPDLILGVLSIARSKLNAGDIAILLHLLANDKKCLFPKKSLTRNIGHDGTGKNCVLDYSYLNQEINNNILIVGNDKSHHYYQDKNLFFYDFGGWKILIINIFKLIFIVIFGERLLKSISNLKSSIKHIIAKKKL